MLMGRKGKGGYRQIPVWWIKCFSSRRGKGLEKKAVGNERRKKGGGGGIAKGTMSNLALHWELLLLGQGSTRTGQKRKGKQKTENHAGLGGEVSEGKGSSVHIKRKLVTA